MGNSQSQARTEQPAQAQNHAQTRLITPSQETSLEEPTNDEILQDDHPTTARRSVFSSARHSILSESWRRESQRLGPENELTSDPLDERPYETEDRPLFHSEHDPPVEPHPERPLNWRHSTMSRLGSRLLPDSVARGLTNSGEETAEEGQALRNGVSSRNRPGVYHRRIASNSQERLSMSTAFRRRIGEPTRNNSRNVVRRLFPSTTAPQRMQIRDDYEESETPEMSDRPRLRPESSTFLDIPSRSRSRLQRVRHSLSMPFSTILGSDRSIAGRHMQLPSSRPSRRGVLEESDELLSPASRSNHRHDLIDGNIHELDAVEPETRNFLSTNRITSGMSSVRRFPHGLRSRSTRLIRRGEHPPLSQVLQLAAAAIAAQLSGSSITASDRPGSHGEAFDGSIQNFVQTLQEAASAQAGQNIDLNATDGDLPPVNFMRVFSFPNDENGTPLATRPNVESSDGMNDQNPDQLDRSVTLVLVGVRSMPNFNDNHSGENGTLGPSLDTLVSLPFLPPANLLRNGSSGALFRRSDTRARTQQRRNSATNFSFPQQYESQRHTRARTSGATRTSVENGLLTPMSESPPGPVPPPSTPADIRSGHATPIRRPSSASAVHNSGLPDLEESNDTHPTTLPAESAFHAARQRQRSDSEFARRPELSSGNSRRNGVVEPDRPSGSAGRSWLIYVVGTNVSPDHPAFTMPSLFTDNPSYEDMQMLSTLLGPVKPPVASHDDVEAAGGLYRITMRGGTLVAESANAAANSAHVLTINASDRCLICLSEYEEDDFVRQIDSCRHVYHRECIDEWLTTGRNSCPMCRGQGVKEGSNSDTNTNTQSEQAERV